MMSRLIGSARFKFCVATDELQQIRAAARLDAFPNERLAGRATEQDRI